MPLTDAWENKDDIVIGNDFGIGQEGVHIGDGAIIDTLCISLKIDHLTGNIRPPSRPGKVILASVKATY